MNQFIIENPVLSIVIAFIIGAVIMNITSADRNHTMEELGIWRNLHSSQKQYYPFSRLSGSDRISFTAMTGRQDLYLYICMTVFSRMNFSGI